MKAFCSGVALAIACLAIAAPASAETYGSVGAGLATMKFDTVPGVDDAKVAVVGGRFGWKSASWYGVEGDLFFGTKKDRVYDAPATDVSVDSAAFIYGVAFLPANEKVDLIARVGYGHLAGKVEGAGQSIETNDGAASAGVGVQYKFDAANGVRVDYTHYAIDDVPSNGFTVSYIRRF